MLMGGCATSRTTGVRFMTRSAYESSSYSGLFSELRSWLTLLA